MTHFLVSDENPAGHMLEDLLVALRRDILLRCEKIIEDPRPEAKQVVANNLQILNLITDAIGLAEDSTQVLDKAFGPSRAADGGPPRIGSV